MSSIGPQIPAHLLQSIRNDVSDDDEDDGPQPAPAASTSTASIGPQIPAHLLSGGSKLQVIDDDDDDEPGPSLPSASSSSRGAPTKKAPSPPRPQQRPVAGPSMPPGHRSIGPTLPNYAPTYDPSRNVNDDDSDEDSDDDFGPKPLPAGMQHQETDAVKEFMEREEKRRKAAEDAAKPKAAKRDEWMLVPPTTSGLLGNLDPTKLKARQFSRGGPSASTSTKNDMSLWTETPAERQQRLADEVSGKKRRVTDNTPTEDEDERARRKRRKEEEEVIRRGVEEHTKKRRGAALVDQHTSASGKKGADGKDGEKEVPGIWDHSRDMGLGGRLMDDDKRNKMLQEAKGLGDRFGSGKGGGFL